MVTTDVLGPAKAREFAAAIVHEAHRLVEFNRGERPTDPPWESLSHEAKDFWCRKVDESLTSVQGTLAGVVGPAAYKVALGYFGDT